LRNLHNDLQLNQEQSTKIYIDNKSAIALAKNLIFHEKSQHIDTRYHFIQVTIKENKVELISVKIQDQLADIFTKPLKHEVFSVIRSQLGMVTLGLRGILRIKPDMIRNKELYLFEELSLFEMESFIL